MRVERDQHGNRLNAEGMSWGQVRDLREARETIRRLAPPLAMLLDVIAPVPPCPHKIRQVTDLNDRRTHPLPTWKCQGCGVPMTNGGVAGPRALTHRDLSNAP